MNAPPAALLDARYRVGPLLARGGMSAVYRGTDTRLDRPVAIKVMEPRLASDPAFRARFEREARLAARIDHPAVVDVHDQGEHASGAGLGLGGDGPLLFLVMELVEGGTLRDVLRERGALGVPAAFAVLDPVLAGLAEAHRLGMVHRDVKPENVLLSRTGEVKVADFGLVTAAAQAGASTAGMIMGTVAYLSPEQVATGDADARSDVYAAGIMFYELLTGAPPYTGDTAISVAYRHVNSDVPPPSQIAGDVPPELDALV
ncbi:MAG: protein kinase domain-containing protein, partial [Pseudonocardia sp.]